MADILATLFKFRQYVLEYGFMFLAAWLALAVVTGLADPKSGKSFKVPGQSEALPRMTTSVRLYQAFAGMFGRVSEGKLYGSTSSFASLLVFGLSASVPALIATSVLGVKIMLLRLMLAIVYALVMGRLISLLMRKLSPLEAEGVASCQEIRAVPSSLSRGDERHKRSKPEALRTFGAVLWKSFSSQFDEALPHVLIGFGVAAALLIYVPTYWIRLLLSEATWYSPYLAAALAIPLQVTGGSEVPLASALLIKGASQGAALSAMLVAPSTTISVALFLRRFSGAARVFLYVIMAWVIAGSLGLAFDMTQRLLRIS